MSHPQTNTAGIETRDTILDAAETLFSEQGYDATSIRQITRLAQVNVAAVHYHFGSKQDVLRAVTDRVIEPLNERRRRLLDELESESSPAALDRIVEAFVRPDVEALQALGRRGGPVGRFLGRLYADPSPWVQAMVSEQFEPIGDRFFQAIAATDANLPADELAWRLDQMSGVVVRMFASWPERGMSDVEAEGLIRRMTGFLTAALSAPPTGGGDEI